MRIRRSFWNVYCDVNSQQKIPTGLLLYNVNIHKPFRRGFAEISEKLVCTDKRRHDIRRERLWTGRKNWTVSRMGTIPKTPRRGDYADNCSMREKTQPRQLRHHLKFQLLRHRGRDDVVRLKNYLGIVVGKEQKSKTPRRLCFGTFQSDRRATPMADFLRFCFCVPFQRTLIFLTNRSWLIGWVFVSRRGDYVKPSLRLIESRGALMRGGAVGMRVFMSRWRNWPTRKERYVARPR